MLNDKRRLFAIQDDPQQCLYEQWMATQTRLNWPQVASLRDCNRAQKGHSLCRMCPRQTDC